MSDNVGGFMVFPVRDGVKVDVDSNNSSEVCPNCKTPYLQQSKFCKKCGTKLQETVPSMQEDIGGQIPVQTVPTFTQQNANEQAPVQTVSKVSQQSTNEPPPVQTVSSSSQQTTNGQAYYNYQQPTVKKPKDKTVAGILGILLGAFGAHKFYLGYTAQAIIMLVISLAGACIAVGPLIVGLIGLIEGIIYLTKTDEVFQDTYVIGKKAWF